MLTPTQYEEKRKDIVKLTEVMIKLEDIVLREFMKKIIKEKMDELIVNLPN